MGRGRGAHYEVSLQISFSLPEKVWVFFSDNASIYEIEHCARWELLFALYSMIFIELSYDIQIADIQIALSFFAV